LKVEFKVTPAFAREQLAKPYLDKVRVLPEVSLPADIVLTDQLSNAQLSARHDTVKGLFGTIADPNDIPQYLQEVFWLVPMALALRLQEERQYLAALDWFQTDYAFNLPPDKRKIYHGLTLEESITSAYGRGPEWLTRQLNPHIIARTSRVGTETVGRKNVYTRFTVMSIVRCLLAYADLEFSRNLAESIVRARTLYETAVDLLGLNDVRPETPSETDPPIPFPTNPVWESLRLHAQSNLAKIHHGLSIAGIRTAVSPVSGPVTVFLPSQYRYAVLVERAKNFVGIAQQVESAFLSALEQRETETYSVFQANHDIEVARSSITLTDLKIADADINVVSAELQQEKAQVQFDHYDQLIKNGLNFWEKGAVKAMELAVWFRAGSSTANRLSLPKTFQSVSDQNAFN
jgi:hypothetical protein